MHASSRRLTYLVGLGTTPHVLILVLVLENACSEPGA